MYSHDPVLRPLLADLGVDGAVLPTRSDYLLVVDTNMGFNKVNARIEQSISYAVNLDETARSQARLALTYTNTAAVRLAECVHAPIYGRVYEDMIERCYWDYVRVYAPLGSTPLLGRQSPDIEVAQDGDKQTLATFFVLPPGEGHTLTIDYALPYGVIQRMKQQSRYVLVVQKQAGTDSLPLSVALALPDGARAISTTPRPTYTSGNTLRYKLTLDRDLVLEVIYVR